MSYSSYVYRAAAVQFPRKFLVRLQCSGKSFGRRWVMVAAEPESGNNPIQFSGTPCTDYQRLNSKPAKCGSSNCLGYSVGSSLVFYGQKLTIIGFTGSDFFFYRLLYCTSGACFLIKSQVPHLNYPINPYQHLIPGHFVAVIQTQVII